MASATLTFTHPSQRCSKRSSGADRFLFCSKTGRPLLQSNVLRAYLYPLLERAGEQKAGAHAFRRFRTTWLRKQHAPEDLIRFWLGHDNRSITDTYCKLNEDVVFRKNVAEQVGIGFELPTENLEVAPNCTQSELLSTFEIKEEEWLPGQDSNLQHFG